jgi:hypothetical protein
MRRYDLQPSAWFRNAMQLSNKSHYVRHVFNNMTANDFVELICFERVRKRAEIMYDVGVTTWIRVETYRAFKLVLTAADIKY